MATVEIQGYVQRPQTKTTKGGKTYVQFGVGVKQKEKAYGDRPEKVTWGNYNVTDWKAQSPLAEKTYVRVKGYLTVREYEKDGQKRTALDVNAQEVEDLSNDAAEPPKTNPQAQDNFDDFS